MAGTAATALGFTITPEPENRVVRISRLRPGGV